MSDRVAAFIYVALIVLAAPWLFAGFIKYVGWVSDIVFKHRKKR
jgi:hypothetical protein